MNSSSPRNPSTSAKNTVSGSGLRQCFGPEGCPAVSNGRRCGETKNLEIIQEFRRLYEDKMKQIDDVAGGDCVQAKINLQQEWIRDLTEQNEMLVRVVEELEVEAAERVTMLEDRLQQSAKCACENERLMKDKEKKLRELEDKIKKLNEVADKHDDTKKTCQELKKSMLDMRDALTAEVAEKHNVILCLRREVRMLEEQCSKGDQQSHFKDDIIKELRKEIKQLKLQRSKKSRSPRTLKRCEHRLVHPTRTDPDTNIRNLKDGTIVIKESTIVGDSVATQVIREKYSDPSNQTIVYICENAPQRQKSKSREASKLEATTAPNLTQKDGSRNCDVSLDNSRNAVGDSRENSREIQHDYSRNGLDQDVSRDSGGSMGRNYIVYPSIQETCIRYSKDILEMLDNHCIEEKKGLDRFMHNDNEEIPTCFDISNEVKIKEEDDQELKEVKVVKDDAQSEDPNGFMSNTLSRCEKYFLEMYRNKCKTKNEMRLARNSNYDEQYLKKFREYYDCDCRSENCCGGLDKYEIPRYISKPNGAASRECPVSKLENQMTLQLNERDIVLKSNSCQTIGYSQSNKNTQTSQTNLLDFDQSVLSEVVIPQPSNRENDISDIAPKEDDVSHDIPHENYVRMVNNNHTSVTDEIWNNSNIKNDEASFEEAEFSAYSTPLYEELPPYYPAEMMLNEHPIKYEGFDLESGFNRAKFFRTPDMRRGCGIPHKVPVVPVRRYVLTPPQIRQTKMLSPRTLRKIPVPKIRHPELPLSIRSRSLPTCADIYASSHDLQKPVRLHKVKRAQNSSEDFVDVAFVVEDRNYRKKLVANDLHGYVELSGRDKTKRMMHDDRFGRWPKMNNTY